MRLQYAKTPTYSCPTTNFDYGGMYELPIATITADEIAYAGGVWRIENTTDNFYLDNSTYFWTMSPLSYAYGQYAGIFTKKTNKSLDYDYSYNSDGILGVRPVIELKRSASVVNGQGTSDNPWIVE